MFPVLWFWVPSPLAGEGQGEGAYGRTCALRPRLTALGLTGAMPRATAAFLAAAHGLFDNALNVPEIKTALAAYGYDAAKVQSERAKIAAFDSANQRREAAKGAAQQATREQEAALQAVSDWAGQYTRIAKVALRDKKHLLEKLGIGVRASKTAAQRAAPQKAAATRAARKQASPPQA